MLRMGLTRYLFALNDTKTRLHADEADFFSVAIAKKRLVVQLVKQNTERLSFVAVVTVLHNALGE